MTPVSAWCAVPGTWARTNHVRCHPPEAQASVGARDKELAEVRGGSLPWVIEYSRVWTLRRWLQEGLAHLLFPLTGSSPQHRRCSPGEQEGHHSGQGQGQREPSRDLAQGPPPPGSRLG